MKPPIYEDDIVPYVDNPIKSGKKKLDLVMSLARLY